MKPLISIYIPTKNRPDLLKRALESLLAQTFKSFEVIVCSDGFDIETEKIALSFNKKMNVSYVFNKGPSGAPATRNTAIKMCKGTFITGLDDDDVFHKDRLEYFYSNWNDSYAFLATRGRRLKSRRSLFLWLKSIFKYQKYVTFDDLLKYNSVGNQVFTLTERLIDEQFDVELPALQDWELWLRLLKKYGNGKILRKETQSLDVNHGGQRVTSYERRMKGLMLVQNKHDIPVQKVRDLVLSWKIEFGQSLNIEDGVYLIKNFKIKLLYLWILAYVR
ncbi:glycosyltransferase [Vibrio breoganii]